jgi:CHAT domain-containing protein
VALSRAAVRDAREPRLLALANPTEDLAATEAEVEEIARHFARGRTRRAMRGCATSSFLHAHGSEASHIHLACHAGAGLFDAGDAAVQLADRLVYADELPALGGLRARVVAVSACQTAVAEITHMPDEVFSISTAMLGAGAACVIASLWPVDDASTAMLMTRFYEELFSMDSRPPEALRRAQLWLRELNNERESAFLAKHPALAAEFRRRAREGAPPGKRNRGSQEHSGSDRPYSEPEYWAPFIAVGA